MAIVQTRFSSSDDGAEFWLEYDDVTLLADRAIFVVPQSLGAPLIVNAQNNQINGGAPFAWQAPPAAQNSQYTFSPQLSGIARINPVTGAHGIEWGFSFMSFGSVGDSPNAGATVIHVSPNS